MDSSLLRRTAKSKFTIGQSILCVAIATWNLSNCRMRLAFLLAAMVPISPHVSHAAPQSTPIVQSLDGDWLLATDARDEGRSQEWHRQPRPEAVTAKVPWIIQDAFPGYHGIAWYWRSFPIPTNPHPEGRILLRFWAVDYKADVWVNGIAVGGHEGGETPFVLDITDAASAGATNPDQVQPGAGDRSGLVAVRVLNPSNERIDGMTLAETPHRNKVIPYSAGASYNHGGIVDSVELLMVPSVRVEDVFAHGDTDTGRLDVRVNLRNAAAQAARATLEVSASPAASGETVAASTVERDLNPGDTPIALVLPIDRPRLWDLHDPHLYRVTARVTTESSRSLHEQSIRCGFRDFRFADGSFRLNGCRIYVRCSHTGNHCPVGLQLPPDPDMLRRDLLNVKVMGFNMVRFISGVATRDQLDLCDEIGLMVYEEPYAAWLLADSPHMKERFDSSLAEMIRRDRNHASLVMWGLLNETSDGPVFRRAVASLPLVRSLDQTRLVMLNSGRFDNATGANAQAGLELWRRDGPDPNVSRNATNRPIAALGITWAPGQLALHPGPNGEFSAVRWMCDETGEHEVSAEFAGIAGEATTDVHVLRNGRALHSGFINLRGNPGTNAFALRLPLAAGDRLDFVVGFGNGNYGGDTTALAATIRSPDGKVWDAAGQFSLEANPNGPWSCGWLNAGARPDAGTFKAYALADRAGDDGIGSLSNPGSAVWEDVLSDQHPYQRVPHTADIVRRLRTLDGGCNPVFLSEYGIGSAVDLVRVVRHYERWGKEKVEDALFYRDKLDRFLSDWDRWRMAEVFGRPEDYFAASLRKMAGQRLLGLNAIRANTNVIGYSLTGTVDQGMSGEGLFTTWRELKPGTVDALFDGWAPLRWCLFAEPVHLYRGRQVRLEAVLANEDAMRPGAYRPLYQVRGPDERLVWERRGEVVIDPSDRKPQPPFALRTLDESIVIDGAPGRYRFVAAFEGGAAPAGGESEFFVADPLPAPPAPIEITVWGEDPALVRWLNDHGLQTRPFSASSQAEREVILAGPQPPAPGGAEAFRDLARHLARGSAAAFLAPEVFAAPSRPSAWVPLKTKGTLRGLNAWLYHKDEWAKTHPIFAGLPTGMLDYTYYREIIPDSAWSGIETPAEAVCGANDASFDYSSGLMVSVHRLGAGRFVLNTRRLREHLGHHPAADRLVWNLVHFLAAGRDQPLADLAPDFEDEMRACGLF